MSTHEISQDVTSHDWLGDEIQKRFFDSAYGKLDPTTDALSKNAQMIAREGLLLADGAIVGAAKTAAKHPLGTGIAALGTIAAGSLVAAGLAAESPIIVGGTILAAGAMTGKGLFDAVNPYDENNRFRNATVMRTVEETARNSDPGALGTNMHALEQAIGPCTLDCGLGLISAGRGMRAELPAKELGTAISWLKNNGDLLSVKIAQPMVALAQEAGRGDILADYLLPRRQHGPLKIIIGQPAVAQHDAEMLKDKIQSQMRPSRDRQPKDLPTPRPITAQEISGRSIVFHERYGRYIRPLVLLSAPSIFEQAHKSAERAIAH